MGTGGALPTASFAGSTPIPNLSVQIVSLFNKGGPVGVVTGALAPPTAVGQGDSRDCTTAEIGVSTSNCVFALRFTLSRIPSQGVQNQAVTVNIQDAAGKILSTVVVTINLNCAPIFQSLMANIGISPSLATQTTLTRGTEIVQLTAPIVPGQDTDTVQAVSAGSLAFHLINYNIPAGVGKSGVSE